MDSITHCSALQPTSLWVCQEIATYATCMLQALFQPDLESTWLAYCKVSSYSLGGQSGSLTRMGCGYPGTLGFCRNPCAGLLKGDRGGSVCIVLRIPIFKGSHWAEPAPPTCPAPAEEA